jgi:hypothetical protein
MFFRSARLVQIRKSVYLNHINKIKDRRHREEASDKIQHPHMTNVLYTPGVVKILSGLETILQSNNNKNSMVLAKKQT